MEEIKISTWQFIALLTVTILSSALLYPPTFIARYAARDAWVAFLLAIAAGMVLAVLINSLAARFPHLSLLQIGERLLGRVAGKLVTASYTFFFILLTAIVIRQFASFMATAFMPETPIEVFGGFILLVSIYPAYQGLEVIGRLSEIILPVIAIFLLTILALMAPEMDLAALRPFLQSEPVSLFRGSLIFFAWAGQVFLLGMLYPYLEKPAKALPSTLTVLGIVGFFMTAGAVSLEAVFGFPFSERLVYALLTFVRMVNIAGLIFERIDALVILIWISGVFIKITFLLYLSTQSIKELFGLSIYRTFLLPTGLLAASLSVALFENSMELEYFLSRVAPLFFLPYLTGIPLLLLLIAWIKGEKEGEKT